MFKRIDPQGTLKEDFGFRTLHLSRKIMGIYALQEIPKALSGVEN
jgi:hypothetical protein